MKRSALYRKTRLRQRRPTPRRSSRVRDKEYLAWVRQQPCALKGLAIFHLRDGRECAGPIEPDHRREGVGAGQKASDRDAWPCCRRHHEDRHALTGVFKGWTKAEVRDFVGRRIAEANALYERSNR